MVGVGRHDFGGRNNEGLGWSECEQQEASVSQALISFLHLDGQSGDNMKIPSCVHVTDHSSAPTLTSMGISFDDTKLDPSDRTYWCVMESGTWEPLRF